MAITSNSKNWEVTDLSWNENSIYMFTLQEGMLQRMKKKAIAYSKQATG